jgi:hypothetical protein
MMRFCQARLYIAAAPPHVSRLLHASRVSRYIVTAFDVEDAIYRVKRAEMRLTPDGVAVEPLPQADQGMRVRVEELKGFCHRIVSFSETATHPVPRRSARTSATR